MARDRLPFFMADFETTTNENDCRVWAWNLCSVERPEFSSKGTDIQSFIDSIKLMDRVVYFHNLKFDGAFLVDWLFRNGYKFTSEDHVKAGQFSTLISKFGQWYQIKVHWFTGYSCEFRDSLKKIPLSVREISGAFDLEESKGTIDYAAERPEGYEPTSEEWDYIRKDVEIVARALSIQLQTTAGKLTVGADALAEYKSLIGGNGAFLRIFPKLSAHCDADIRSAYRGGWTYVRHDRKGIPLGSGEVFDVNSLYPHVMYSCLLPYGDGYYFPSHPVGIEQRPLWIASITFIAKLKDNYLPCIQVKGNSHYAETDYVTEISEPLTISVSSVDYALWSEHYDLEVLSWNGGYSFEGATGLFKDYVDKWTEIKEQSSGGLRFMAKLMLNSLYGKLATNPDVTPKIPVFEDNVVKLKSGPVEMRDPVYTPAGVFITSYARDMTIRAAQQNYGRFAYADTDSLHVLDVPGEPPISLSIHPSRRGAWKREYSFSRAFYARAKAYTELRSDTGDWETHIAGLPRTIANQVSAEDFTNGRKFPGKLVPKRVPGGIVLTDVEYTLNL